MNRLEIRTILLVAIMIIAACVETDIYLPAFPDMMAHFEVSEEAIQRLLTINFVGICASGCFYGPISDAIGRKKPLMFALGIFLVGSLMTLVGGQFSTVLTGRFLQGIGRGGCFILSTAVLFDVFHKEKAVQANNYINASIPFIMSLAPLVGGFLNARYGFQTNFLFITLLVLASFLITAFMFQETLPSEGRKPLQMTQVTADFKHVLSSSAFWKIVTILSLTFAGYMAYISNIAVLFVVDMGVSRSVFPFYQASILIMWLLGSLTCNRLVVMWGAEKVKTYAIGFLIAGAVGIALATGFAPQSPFLVSLGMLIFTLGANWINGLYFPECIELFPQIKGVVSSIFTTVRLLLTAGVVAISSHFYNATIYPISATMLTIAAISLSLIVLYERERAVKAQSE